MNIKHAREHCTMINAKDYVEKCVTFVLAHLFAFATANLFCILSNFGGFVCPPAVLIHPKSESPGSPDSANYLNIQQNYSLRMRKLPTLLC